MPVSKRLRFEILRRDNHACKYCGATAPDAKLTVDHVVPVTLGGSDDPSNLVAACAGCNGGKSSIPADAAIVEDVAADAARWARAMQQAADEIASADVEIEDICDAVHAAWRPRYIPNDFEGSIFNFFKAGLTKPELLSLVAVAHAARGVDDRWAYFCGCCWKRIKKRQQRAAEIVSEKSTPAPPAPVRTTWTAEFTQDYTDTVIEWLQERHPHADPFNSHCVHDIPAKSCSDQICSLIVAQDLLVWTKSREQFSSEVTEILDDLDARKQEADGG